MPFTWFFCVKAIFMDLIPIFGPVFGRVTLISQKQKQYSYSQRWHYPCFVLTSRLVFCASIRVHFICWFFLLRVFFFFYTSDASSNNDEAIVEETAPTTGYSECSCRSFLSTLISCCLFSCLFTCCPNRCHRWYFKMGRWITSSSIAWILSAFFSFVDRRRRLRRVGFEEQHRFVHQSYVGCNRDPSSGE